MKLKSVPCGCDAPYEQVAVTKQKQNVEKVKKFFRICKVCGHRWTVDLYVKKDKKEAA